MAGPGVSTTTRGESRPSGAAAIRADSSRKGAWPTGSTWWSAKASGNARRMKARFWTTYESPDGQRRLSSSTRQMPSSSRTRSMPGHVDEAAERRLARPTISRT